MTSSPSLLNHSLQACNDQWPSHLPTLWGNPAPHLPSSFPRAEETCIFTEGASPFKHHSVVILCSLSLSPLTFSTHRVTVWDCCNPLPHSREGKSKEQCKRSSLDRSCVLGMNLATIALIIEFFICLSLSQEQPQDQEKTDPSRSSERCCLSFCVGGTRIGQKQEGSCQQEQQPPRCVDQLFHARNEASGVSRLSSAVISMRAATAGGTAHSRPGAGVSTLSQPRAHHATKTAAAATAAAPTDASAAAIAATVSRGDAESLVQCTSNSSANDDKSVVTKMDLAIAMPGAHASTSSKGASAKSKKRPPKLLLLPLELPLMH